MDEIETLLLCMFLLACDKTRNTGHKITDANKVLFHIINSSKELIFLSVRFSLDSNFVCTGLDVSL